MPQPTYQYSHMPENPDFSNFDFSNPLPADQTYPDPSAFDGNNFNYAVNKSQQPTYGSNVQVQPSTELVRRARNQQLAPQSGPQQQEQWNGYGNVGAQVDDEDEYDLDQRVALAKKDAQGKRKQIPPFVQKLSR